MTPLVVRPQCLLKVSLKMKFETDWNNSSQCALSTLSTWTKGISPDWKQMICLYQNHLIMVVRYCRKQNPSIHCRNYHQNICSGSQYVCHKVEVVGSLLLFVYKSFCEQSLLVGQTKSTFGLSKICNFKKVKVSGTKLYTVLAPF